MLERPIFIVAPPRSGVSFLLRTLGQSPDVATLSRTLDELIESVEGLHPRDCGYESHRLTADRATPEIVSALSDSIAASLRDREGKAVNGSYRLLGASGRSALRVPFLLAAFPGTRFVVL